MAKGKGAADCCMACGAAAFCCLVTLVVLGLLGLGIAKIVMGAIYLDDCPIEKLIPVYLIVSGVAPIFFGGFGRRGDDDSGSSTVGMICGTIGLLFNLAWLICGSVWVYPNYGTVTEENSNSTCNESLFTFAFAMVTIDWICMGFWIILFGCAIAKVCCN